jgi:hypothetical protein
MVEREDGPVERWIAQVVVDGRKRRVSARTEAAATKELRRLLRSIDDGKSILDGSLTLGRCSRNGIPRCSSAATSPARHSCDTAGRTHS